MSIELEHQTRDYTVDILKGIGIMLVVLGHCECPLTHFIYLFHVPLFFMASGYFYKTKYSDSFGNLIEFVKKRIISLWMPFVIWNSIFVLCNNLFLKINIYTDNPLFLQTALNNDYGLGKYLTFNETIIQLIKVFFIVGSTQIGGASWFIRALFVLCIMFVGLDFIFKRIRIKQTEIAHLVAGAAFLLVAFILKNSGLPSTADISLIFLSYISYAIGFFVKKIELMNRFKNPLWVGLPALVVLIIQNFMGPSGINDYGANPLFYIIALLAGWGLTWSISRLIFLYSKKLQYVMVYIGQNTIPIIFLHLLFFKIISTLQVFLYHEPGWYIASFTILHADGIWWLAYFICGLSLPLVVNFIFVSLKKVRVIHAG